MEYPYYNLYADENKILNDFNKLQKFYPKVIENLTSISLLSVEENYTSHLYMIKITDWFSESERVRCQFKKFRPPIEVYQETKNYYKRFLKNYKTIDDKLSQNIRMCNNFPVTLVMTVLKLFNPQKMLDMSSGWGDRLIGAIAYGCEYTGVDPNVNLKQKYKDIIDFFKADPKKYKVFTKGFENFKVKKEEYDLVFSSPPFFDLEVYSDQKTQSIEKFSNLNNWKKYFLFPSLKKSLEGLKAGGHLAIYISDYGKIKYTKDTKDYVKSLGNNEFIGTVNWINIDGSKAIRNIYVWRKI